MSAIPSRDLEGHVALITGANHGIGRATAQLLAQRGASVTVTYLRSTFSEDHYPDAYRLNRRLDGADVAQQIRYAGGNAHAIEVDLLSEGVAVELFDETVARFGPVDILINNATGHCAHDTFNVTTESNERKQPVVADVIDRTFGVDVKAAALLIAEFARRLHQRDGRWGRIVGLTSGGPMGFPGEVTYGAAKAALENYTLAASIELGELGVTANMVYPPVTDTGWVTDDVRQFVASSSDHIHVAEPSDVAGVIAFLCSEDARMITGNIIRMR